MSITMWDLETVHVWFQTKFKRTPTKVEKWFSKVQIEKSGVLNPPIPQQFQWDYQNALALNPNLDLPVTNDLPVFFGELNIMIVGALDGGNNTAQTTFSVYEVQSISDQFNVEDEEVFAFGGGASPYPSPFANNVFLGAGSNKVEIVSPLCRFISVGGIDTAFQYQVYLSFKGFRIWLR